MAKRAYYEPEFEPDPVEVDGFVLSIEGNILVAKKDGKRWTREIPDYVKPPLTTKRLEKLRAKEEGENLIQVTVFRKCPRVSLVSDTKNATILYPLCLALDTSC